jgi:hypothetical protein
MGLIEEQHQHALAVQASAALAPAMVDLPTPEGPISSALVPRSRPPPTNVSAEPSLWPAGRAGHFMLGSDKYRGNTAPPRSDDEVVTLPRIRHAFGYPYAKKAVRLCSLCHKPDRTIPFQHQHLLWQQRISPSKPRNMGKARIDADAESDNYPYSVEFFAEKHGLTLKAAEVILHSNGPSRAMCDAAARAFLAALAIYRKTG